jgi:DNA-binding CsgD family transcriptional regulator
MIGIQQWLLRRQRELHYLLFTLSGIILVCCLAVTSGDKRIFTFFLQTISLLLFVICFLYTRAATRYNEYGYLIKRIQFEYRRVVYKQSYKLDRLARTEFEVLAYILNEYSIEEIAAKMEIDYRQIYRYIDTIRKKLEIKKHEGLLDLDRSIVI